MATNSEFYITVTENEREQIIYIAEYCDGKMIQHDVEKPEQLDEDSIKKIDNYIDLYGDLSEEEKNSAREKLTNRIHYHKWLNTARAKLEVLKCESQNQ